MNTLIKQIREQTAVNFINLETAVMTYSRDALVCGSPAWRYVYHTIHSADKWFIDPFDFTEPAFHTEGLDNPDKPSSTVLTDSQLIEYLSKVREKTFAYLDTLDDSDLYEKPKDCPYTRLELVLGQFRHISLHTGMLNGQTIERTDRFPVALGLDKNGYKRLEKSLYDE